MVYNMLHMLESMRSQEGLSGDQALQQLLVCLSDEELTRFEDGLRNLATKVETHSIHRIAGRRRVSREDVR